MVYLVTKNQELSDNNSYVIITVPLALDLMKDWNTVQFDTETTGIDCHIDKLLTMQFGNYDKSVQIVVDCNTINPKAFKGVLEDKFIIGQNLKFDLQFLYKLNIVPKKVYDTMIAEQVLYLGYPKGIIGYSLKEIAKRYLDIDIDKTIRGQINWRGLDTKVIEYAANDVVYLYDIMQSQMILAKQKEVTKAIELECKVVPMMAYMEFCGIHLDPAKWKAKMQQDKENLDKALNALNEWVTKQPCLKKYVYYNKQGNLFEGFDTKPKISINWASSLQVVKVAKLLGFNTTVQDKKTKEDKDSVIEKHLKTQKGINDEFLKLYFDFQEHFKTVTSFGQGHLNAINPITERIHTVYRQLGAKSGRMSCGSNNSNNSLAKLKSLSPKECTYLNIQQLPHDAQTRACFTAEKGNLWCSCDYAAIEAKLGAMIYNEKVLINEFLHGSGDTHAAYAKAVFAKELEGIDTKDVKKKRPDLRSKVKSIEFAIQFGSDGTAAAPQMGCSIEEAKELVNNLLQNMKGLAAYKISSSKEVRKKGYVLAMPQTGHKVFWYDHKEWLEEHQSYTSDFWEDYKSNHKGTGDYIAQEVSRHFKKASEWDRLALNIPTQGGGAVILKTAMIMLWEYILKNNLFNKVLLVNATHDELNCEFPETLKEFPKVLESIMLEAGKKYYTLIPLNAEAEVSDHWVH